MCGATLLASTAATEFCSYAHLFLPDVMVSTV